MSNVHMTDEYKNERISFSCALVGTVFFVVLWQALILRAPDIVTQVFRPLIVFFLLIKMEQRGIVKSKTMTVAAIAAVYEFFVTFMNPLSGEALRAGAAVVLYLLMYCAVCGTPWNKRELKTIVLMVFLGSVACAVSVMLSNDIADLSGGASHDIYLFGIPTNRNKNAYAFSIGTILGVIYTAKNTGARKVAFIMMTAMTGFCLMYCQCRGAFLCAVAGIFVLVGISLLKMKKYDVGKAIICAFLFVLFCIGAYFLILNSPFSRLIDGENKSGRDDGIKYAIGLFKDYNFTGKIFGRGFTYEAEHTEGVGAHLVYVAFLLSSGIVGSGLIAIMLLLVGFKVKGTIPFALFTIAFLRTFFEGLDYYTYIPLVLAINTYKYEQVYRRPAYELFKR